MWNETKRGDVTCPRSRWVANWTRTTGRSSDLQSWVFDSLTLRSRPILRFHDSVTLWFYNSKTKHNNASAPDSLGTEEEHGLDLSTTKNIFFISKYQLCHHGFKHCTQSCVSAISSRNHYSWLAVNRSHSHNLWYERPFSKITCYKNENLRGKSDLPQCILNWGVLWTVCVPHNS